MVEVNTPGNGERGRVAVVIPCFNDGATVPAAVQSVTAQDRLDELVVVDDGSTDLSTIAVLARLEETGIRVVRRVNGGLGLARMTGVEATSADYVFPLDADDRLLPGALSALADKLDADTALALVWGDYQLFGTHHYLQRTAETLDPWQITYQNDLPASALVRRSALLAAGGWELRGGYEDWDLWMALAERHRRGARIPAVVYEYRQHGPRMLGDSASTHGDIYRLLQTRHPQLFADRRRAWRQSQAPLLLRVALPVIFSLPLSPNHRRQIAGVANHLAHRRGLRLLVGRVRSKRHHTAPSH